MDIVIPLGKGSLHHNAELRYCLRSIEMYVPDHGNIFIIGELPDWLQEVIHIPAVDSPHRELKEQNIFKKIMLACNDKRVSDDFYFFNDDHFLCRQWNFSYDYKCSLQDSIRSRRVHDTYYRTLHNTHSFLRGGNNFDTHAPIIYNKEKFKRSVGIAPWHMACGFGIKSLYCNMNGIEGRRYPDLKVNNGRTLRDLWTMIETRDYFSVGDGGLNQDFLMLLNMLYPNKSKYEI